MFAFSTIVIASEAKQSIGRQGVEIASSLHSSQRHAIYFMLSLLIVLLTLPGPARGFSSESPDGFFVDFDNSKQIQGWVGEGIEARQFRGGIFQFLGKEEVRLLSPPGINLRAEDNPYLKIRLRIYSPRILRVFWLTPGEKRKLPFVAIQPHFDNRSHTYWVKLTNSPGWRGLIEQIGLAFNGKPGWIEIDSIKIGPFSPLQYVSDQWGELWTSQGLQLGTINSLNSPRLFNKPFISWLNKLAVLIFLLGAIFYYKASKIRRLKIAVQIGLAILALWLIYDVRETISQFKIVEEIYQSYVKPPPEEKTFPALGDFYQFVEFCRKHIPNDAIFELLPYPYWPFDCRLKYFLYPARMETGAGRSYFGKSLQKYFIVYHAPGIIFDSGSGRLMIQDEKTVFSEKGSLVARYDSGSFIYKVEKEK